MLLRTVIFGVGLYVAVLVGCAADETIQAGDEAVQVAPGAILLTYIEEASENAVLRQMTIYPYHFISGTARLNDLGRRDVSILARHYRDQTRRLNVVSGVIHKELYAARTESVRAALIAAGVQESLITIVDGLPGGDGMSSSEVLILLENDAPRSGSMAEWIQK